MVARCDDAVVVLCQLLRELHQSPFLGRPTAHGLARGIEHASQKKESQGYGHSVQMRDEADGQCDDDGYAEVLVIQMQEAQPSVGSLVREQNGRQYGGEQYAPLTEVSADIQEVEQQQEDEQLMRIELADVLGGEHAGVKLCHCGTSAFVQQHRHSDDKQGE